MLKTNLFQEGHTYSRRQICDLLKGGSVQSYLISIDERIVAGCFGLDLNPRAPEEVYPGAGKIIEGSAMAAVAQSAVYHAFIKRGNKAFEYRGLYQAYALSHSASDIRAAEALTPDRKQPITGVLRSRKVNPRPCETA